MFWQCLWNSFIACRHAVFFTIVPEANPVLYSIFGEIEFCLQRNPYSVQLIYNTVFDPQIALDKYLGIGVTWRGRRGGEMPLHNIFSYVRIAFFFYY
jgi:hypothetical protein